MEKIEIKLLQYHQTNEIQSEVEALAAVISPILKGILLSLNREIVEGEGGYGEISLRKLARLYREGDGDCGICFEYAVHDAIINNNPDVLDRIDTALTKHCKIKNGDLSSILFGAEKSGALQLIDSVEEHLTDDSQLLTGSKGQPIKLKKHIQGVINAFRKPSLREKLPNSINGLWKADLFVGKTEPDKWVGTTVKINPKQLEAAKGLRLAIVPAKQGRSDKIYIHDTKNLIVCPVPYDESFMEIFYEGWLIVKYFLNCDANIPPEKLLPHGVDRYMCKFLNERKIFNVVDVIEALDIIRQPHLLESDEKEIEVFLSNKDDIQLNSILAPISIK